MTRRVRQNNIQGTLSSTLASGTTTMTSAGLANLEAISSTEHAALNIDPGRGAGAPEIVYVTGHTASSTSATISRGEEGTSARAHSTGVTWLHAPTRQDYVLVIDSTASRPTTPFIGQLVWNTTDNQLEVNLTGSTSSTAWGTIAVTT